MENDNDGVKLIGFTYFIICLRLLYLNMMFKYHIYIYNVLSNNTSFFKLLPFIFVLMKIIVPLAINIVIMFTSFELLCEHPLVVKSSIINNNCVSEHNIKSNMQFITMFTTCFSMIKPNTVKGLVHVLTFNFFFNPMHIQITHFGHIL